ncbi:hypothetical protein ILYODFUR_017581, partial [Ilyodon furcidens]
LVSWFLFPCPSHFTVNKTHYRKSLSPELLFCMWVRSVRTDMTHAWVLTGYSGFLPQSKDMPVRLIGHYKLPLGV